MLVVSCHPSDVAAFLFYDLLMLCFVQHCYFKAAKAQVNKLEHNKTVASHKIKMLRQQLRRLELNKSELDFVVDLSAVPCEEDGTTENDVRVQLVMALEEKRLETERLARLLRGSGKGRGKSPEFEFAARTILASGCSARSAKDNILVAANLFLSRAHYIQFEEEVPSDRWFRSQRKGLGYEAWLYSMLRVAKCDSILQWGFDETRYCNGS